MLLVKHYSWLSIINIPVSDKLFGKNKTWRGFIFLITVNALLVFTTVQLFSIQLNNSALLGAILGFTYL
jgi:hypothetical protein